MLITFYFRDLALFTPLQALRLNRFVCGLKTTDRIGLTTRDTRQCNLKPRKNNVEIFGKSTTSFV